ncbi:ABC transporter permease [Kribbella italica]|uniref:Peptide/nickel transport system permease protein n=1 Tax=Kribbella italica TaxID=1540520 RepID=A0A7W9JED0_9ACTN|nr:ABC transporter permease [Kribbella italica]MBB5840611.1 peptide/nickel transport system permease protein [Kribbella italica]
MTGVADLITSRAVRRTRRGSGRVPAVVIGLYLFVAVLGPMLIDYDPVQTPLEDRLLSPGSHTSSGGTAVLGTDALGRDVLAQIVYGARTSVIIGLATVAVCVVVGLLVGFAAGYYRGVADAVLSRLVDVLQAFPGILLAIVIAGVFTPNLWVIVLALSVTGWISFARVARSVVLGIRERYWVDAAWLVGVRTTRLLGRHILPFTVGPVVAMATLEFALVVLAEAGLSFLGIGLPSSSVSWGQTVANGKEYLGSAWWISAAPGLALAVLVVSVGLLGDSLTARYGRARS